MSAANEDVLVRECNQLSDHINDDLIRLQDSAYHLGFQRGVESSGNVVPLLYEVLEQQLVWWKLLVKTMDEGADVNATIEAATLLINNALRAARGEG